MEQYPHHDLRPGILVVDDDPGIRDTLWAILKKDYRAYRAATGEEAMGLITQEEIHVVLLDILLPGIGGLDVLKWIKERFEDIEVIMITAVKDVGTAVEAMKSRAFDYITKEFDYDDVRAVIERALEKQKLCRQIQYLHSEMSNYVDEDFVVGRSVSITNILDVLKRAAEIETTVLLLGESGTGKEQLARFVHRNSPRADFPMVTVNMASIPSELLESILFGHEKGAFTGAYRQHIGKFELAHRGTIFLDEISDLRIDLQGKLLRVLQEGEIERVGGNKSITVDVRLIVASNSDLREAIDKGTFREDLFYRLNVIPVKVPALRNRIEDIPIFVDFFIKKYNKKFRKNVKGMRQEAVDILSKNSWPGNIRELENLIERLIALSETEWIGPQSLPIEYHFPSFVLPAKGMPPAAEDKSGQPPMQQATDALRFPSPKSSVRDGNFLRESVQAFERIYIFRVLERNNWNRRKASRELRVSLATLKRKIKSLRISTFKGAEGHD